MIYLLYRLIGVLLLFVAYKILAFFRKESALELSVEQDINGEPKEYLLPATKAQILVNHLVDNTLIIIYMITSITAIMPLYS